MTVDRHGSGKKSARIVLTERDLGHLSERFGTASPSVLAKRTGLPYLLVYNLVHRRVRSVSKGHYHSLFGRPAPRQVPLKIDGASFRTMARLWLFLNDGLTKADLYRDLYGLGRRQKSDHRIFNGKINAVEGRIEHRMRQKFIDAGVDGVLLDQWLDEFAAQPHDERIPYARIRPLLAYLADKLDLHPTSVLNQSIARYESGMLRSVPRGIFERAERLKRKTERAIRLGGGRDLEKIRESVVGGKPGYTLYGDIRQELLFLCRFTGKGAKRYLGRGRRIYETGKVKRVATWRAARILRECDRFIRRSPFIPLASLPPSRRHGQVRMLMDLLRARISQLLSEDQGIDFEKRILRPSHPRSEYTDPRSGFTPFDLAARALGMQRRAFDLMVARHCDIFRSVGRFDRRWYLPDLYLKELSRKKEFGLVSLKYEWMAKKSFPTRATPACLQ